MSGNLHSGHRERLRRRFLDTGMNGFSEHELLELILFYALPRVNTNELSHRLLTEFGSIPKILDADVSELAEVHGLSSGSASFLKLLGEFSRQYSSNAPKRISFHSSEELCRYFSENFTGADNNVCMILNLSLNLELISVHTFTAAELLTSMTPRELASFVIRNDIERFAVGICHPNDLPVPSESDYAVVKLLADTLIPINTEFYDAVICGRGSTFSIRSKGAFSFFTGRGFE